MDDRSVSKDSISDFARFVALEAIENHREEHPNFSQDAEFADAFAKELVDQYRRNDSARSVLAPPGAQAYGVTSTSTSGESTFPIDFDVPIPFGSLHGQVTNPSNNEYLLTGTFKIVGITLDKTEIRFKDGVLSRTEEINVSKYKVSTTFTIDLSDGVHLGIEGHVRVLFANFDIGPYRLP
ncbi:hypothetical protein [Lysobacter enzymogenes]|uniref:hypothetical protein n=1 Tax=Lysobacter enzymogenes TaxID=69 RepID=UPI001AF80AD2|nr:hypothetical protein [Lysobacter enzymogenes]QQQ00811.1 hypothetical protein JHW41_22540 [Lysobacter enzymogenes]